MKSRFYINDPLRLGRKFLQSMSNRRFYIIDGCRFEQVSYACICDYYDPEASFGYLAPHHKFYSALERK